MALEPPDDHPPEKRGDRGGDEHITGANPTTCGRDMEGDAGGSQEGPRRERDERREDDGGGAGEI